MKTQKIVKCKKCKASCLVSVAQICDWDVENKLCAGCKPQKPVKTDWEWFKRMHPDSVV